MNAQSDRTVEALVEKLFKVAEHLPEARADVLAFTAFPKELWRQVWSNNPQERLNREIAGVRTSSGSSPTATPSSAWSTLSWLKSTMNGPKDAATSAPRT